MLSQFTGFAFCIDFITLAMPMDSFLIIIENLFVYLNYF